MMSCSPVHDSLEARAEGLECPAHVGPLRRGHHPVPELEGQADRAPLGGVFQLLHGGAGVALVPVGQSWQLKVLVIKKLF